MDGLPAAARGQPGPSQRPFALQQTPVGDKVALQWGRDLTVADSRGSRPVKWCKSASSW